MKAFPLTVRIALLASFVCLPTISALAASAVRDEGNLLSPAAESEALKLAREIEDRTKLDVVVETVALMPDTVRSQYDAKPDQHGAVVREWAVGRARQAGVAGVYVLVVRQPGAFELLPTKQATSVFPRSDSDQVSSVMRAGFKAGDFDRGVIDGLTVMRDKMVAAASSAGPSGAAAPATSGPEARTAPGASTSSGGGSGGGGSISMGSIILFVLIGVVVLFVIRRMFAGRSQRQQQGYGQPGAPGGPPPLPGQGGYDPRYGGQQGQPQQGGGFGRGLAGGLLGGVAGSYLYNQMAGGNQSQAAPADPSAQGGGEQGLGGGGGSSTNDEFGQGSGGTFDSPGDLGGGGDFGDSGGGDF